MSDLKFFLWNNKTGTSTRSRYQKKQFRLHKWPDFGFVGCPSEYILLSAHLIKRTMSYEQLLKLSNSTQEVVNHFIYVCVMLDIIDVKDNQGAKRSHADSFANSFTAKLKSIFF